MEADQTVIYTHQLAPYTSLKLTSIVFALDYSHTILLMAAGLVSFQQRISVVIFFKLNFLKGPKLKGPSVSMYS